MEQEIYNLKINMAEIQKDISFIKDAFQTNKESLKQNVADHKEIIQKIDSFIQSAENKFVAKKEHQELMNNFDNLSDHIGDTYVSKESFKPIQKIVFGLVGAILLAFLYAIIELVIKR